LAEEENRDVTAPGTCGWGGLPGRASRGRAALASVAVVASACVATGAKAQVQTSAPQGPAGPLPRAGELHPCASAVERCEGELRVPLDWDDPGSEEITVAFVWLPRSVTT